MKIILQIASYSFTQTVEEPSHARARSKRFTQDHQEVMEVLWEHSPLKPDDILNHLERPLSNTALRSLVRILTDKKHLMREKRDKAYYDKPKTNMFATKFLLWRLSSSLDCRHD